MTIFGRGYIYKYCCTTPLSSPASSTPLCLHTGSPLRKNVSTIYCTDFVRP
ncbi:MAG: hypothetical protein IKX43_09855 [Paludibacteraceae bacterium]|nr:hypothetical protein [Paludibacteraceae bacterium]